MGRSHRRKIEAKAANEHPDDQQMEPIAFHNSNNVKCNSRMIFLFVAEGPEDLSLNERLLDESIRTIK